MTAPPSPEPPAAATGRQTPARSLRRSAVAVAALALSLLGWALLAWMALDMDSDFAQLTMPAGPDWDLPNLLAIGAMWAVMMAAMMLPSALPMVLTFVDLSERRGQRSHSVGFVAAYLLAWFAFSVAAVGAQWALQLAGWVNPMIVSTSVPLTALLLVIAGLYQFSPLKRVCLARCRTPIGFLIGEWRGGALGSFLMGWRHGLFCLGCCWALMTLLFVGGVMNLAWIVALTVAVAIEKLAPGGERVGMMLGAALVGAGVWKLAAAMYA
jgi:predicted metal-binding membrane protein